jgi:hypothetical protein
MQDALPAISCSTRLNCKPQLDRSAATARTRFECRIAEGRGRRQFAGTIASKRQLTGIFELDDGFKAASSLDRLSSLDPQLSVGRSKCWR